MANYNNRKEKFTMANYGSLWLDDITFYDDVLTDDLMIFYNIFPSINDDVYTLMDEEQQKQYEQENNISLRDWQILRTHLEEVYSCIDSDVLQPTASDLKRFNQLNHDYKLYLRNFENDVETDDIIRLQNAEKIFEVLKVCDIAINHIECANYAGESYECLLKMEWN
ncbi:hypothetical protein [Ligilactobacillus equi]|uniref:Uncharacterized protein n=1 Tax=Ligilactobacillus equi DSM 15833 = JCM 10991 TaxID=1423740 RepID=A0A0R1TD03_9LACO|nr:hypothetical protein [Ligilactobacillus equi]KRL79217.1 hypothetical protein FC36_GL000870 [Ligilactobacillus equi DSM 15833 = JCM 10991]